MVKKSENMIAIMPGRVTAQAQQTPHCGCYFSDVWWTMKARLLADSVRVVDVLKDRSKIRMA